jgi:hypothetical protein
MILAPMPIMAAVSLGFSPAPFAAESAVFAKPHLTLKAATGPTIAETSAPPR